MPIAAASETPHRTKQEFAYRTLRDAIMRCDLRPGERLIIDDLAHRLNVSIIPIREAIQMLQSEGLVVTIPHAGATVAPVSRESIQDVFTVLEGLETVATRLVAERADAGQLNTLGALVDDMDAAVAAKRYDDWASLNTQFHLTIGALPGLALLREMTERVLARWGRVRRFYFRDVLVRRAEQAQQEHRAILRAMRSRDLAALEALVRQHNRRALDAYMAYLDTHTDRRPARSSRASAPTWSTSGGACTSSTSIMMGAATC
jgi:DNA-binding GntR family transcriptional regulator